MTAGFVYVLSNPAMPGLYKVGSTIHAPGARAADLSRATGVPSPFSLRCYAKFAECRRVERSLHDLLYLSRHVRNREFFTEPRRIVSLLYWHPESQGFFDANAGRDIDWDTPFEKYPIALDVLDCDETRGFDLDDLPNPWVDSEQDRARLDERRRVQRLAHAQRVASNALKRACAGDLSTSAREAIYGPEKGRG